MQLLRYGPAGQEKPGMLDADGRIRDLSGEIADVNPAALHVAQFLGLFRIDSVHHGFIRIVDDLVPDHPLPVEAFDLLAVADGCLIAAHARISDLEQTSRLIGLLASRAFVERGETDAIQEIRRRFQQRMAVEFTAIVEQATGRSVRAFLSETNLEADVAVEIFLLGEPRTDMGDFEPS